MTIHEAIASGIKQLTCDKWNRSNGRITISITSDGKAMGPWVTVEDRATDIGELPPQKVLFTALMDFPVDGWKPWNGQDSVAYDRRQKRLQCEQRAEFVSHYRQTIDPTYPYDK